MNITVTCRYDYKTDEVRNYAREKVKKLSRFFKNITKIEIVLDLNKSRHSAEGMVSVARGSGIKAKVFHEDPHAAVDLVIDKIERQLVRFKERLKDRRGGRRGEGLAGPAPAGAGGPDEEVEEDADVDAPEDR